MTFPRWRDLAELVGVTAIVASLIFVGLQMKQSQSIAIGTQYQERANTAIEGWRHRQLNPFFTRRIGQRELDNHGKFADMDENASVEELGDRYVELVITILTYDNLHFQYEAGFLTQEFWESQLRSLTRLVAAPSYQHFVELHAESYRASYAKLLRDLVVDK